MAEFGWAGAQSARWINSPNIPPKALPTRPSLVCPASCSAASPIMPRPASRPAKTDSQRPGPAPGQDLDRLIRCRTCPIGAQHSGQTVTHFSPLHGSMIWPTLRQGHDPHDRRRLCVSCRNRELERAKGRNSKGTKPVKTKSLDAGPSGTRSRDAVASPRSEA
jgi:hypothetical protein